MFKNLKQNNYYEVIIKEFAEFVEDHQEELEEAKRTGDADTLLLMLRESQDGRFIYEDDIDADTCASVLRQSNNVETDPSHWEGLRPLDALKVQTFATILRDLEAEAHKALKV